MTKQDWVEHIEIKHNITRPTLSSNAAHWRSIVKQCLADGCIECKARAKTVKASSAARLKRQCYEDLGLKRVVGTFGGVYYE